MCSSTSSFPTHGCFSRGRARSTRSAGWGLLGGGLRSSLATPGVLSHSGLSNCTEKKGLERKELNTAYLVGGVAGINQWTFNTKMCQFRATYQSPEKRG
jgi:hypothetical protein